MSQELFDEAIRLEEEGRDDQALVIWQQLAESNPTKNVFLRLARVAQNLGLTDDAEQAFKRVLEIDGNSVLALMGLGVLALDNSNYKAAVEHLKRACELEEDPGGLSHLGVALKEFGRPIEAEIAFRRAISIDPAYEEAYFNLATLFTVDRPSEANALLRKALELDPEYAAAHRELGFVLSKSNAIADAESHLRKAVALDPNDGWARIYLGTCLWQSKKVDAAIEEFQWANALNPDWAVPLWSLGNIFDQESIDLNLAQSFFERSLELAPDNWQALTGLARVHNNLGRIALAQEYMNRGLKQRSQNE